MAGHALPRLFTEKGGRGFPYLAILDAEGNLLAKHFGQRTLEMFRETGRRAQAKAQVLLDLKAKAGQGDAAAIHAYLLAQLELGHLKLEEARRRADELANLSQEQTKKLRGLLADLEVEEIAAVRDETSIVEAGRKCFEMKRAGRVPIGAEAVQAFWFMILEYAEDRKDAVAFEEGLDALRSKFGADPRMSMTLQEKEAVLKKLKDRK